jgi:GMP synthase (glutamine-hydrolysing)
MHDMIAILDFGSQYTPLIARRLRELGVYAVVHPHDVTAAQLAQPNLRGIILSGGPASAFEVGAPRPAAGVLALDVPVLGICYGMQLLTLLDGGDVQPHAQREYGRAQIELSGGHALLEGLDEREFVWMSHGDRVTALAPGYVSLASTQDGVIAAIAHDAARRYALQFHPEVTHTPHGRQILRNFALTICGCRNDWSVADYLTTVSQDIQDQVGDNPVIVLVSGGVDSTVTAAILLKALKPEQVIAIHVDSGLMRAEESKAVMASLETLGLTHLHLVDASVQFLEGLKGITDPESKRQVIGDTFIAVQDAELARLNVDAEAAFLAQGTLYTDIIESGASGKQTATIKTHHNVGTPLVMAKRAQGRLVEPCSGLFKDEVRELGLLLGIPRQLIERHPFPGPGLGIRILGEVTCDRLELLRAADHIYLDELRHAKLYTAIWQAFAVLLPINAVGVQGDGRTYGSVITLRAVDSIDGMTADFHPIPFEVLARVASRITNEVPGINRVVFDVTSKPPATIEWE